MFGRLGVAKVTLVCLASLGLAAILFFFAGVPAFAATFECERKSHSYAGYVSLAAMESWFPKNVFFDTNFATQVAKQNRVTFSEGYSYKGNDGFYLSPDFRIILLSSGIMTMKARDGAEFVSTSARHYKCELNAEEVLKILAEGESFGEANASLSNDKSANTSSTSKIDKAKSTCTELGFTAGTQKHGECVLKVMDY